MTKPSILFVCGGRRKQLAKLFIERGFDVYALDKEPNNPINDVATDVVSGWDFNTDAMTANKYIKEVMTSFYHIDLALPLHDSILMQMAVAKDPQYVVGSVVGVSTLCDKQLFANFMREEFPQYYPYIRGSNESVIVKPRYGCGSGGIQKMSYGSFFSDPEVYYSVFGEGDPPNIVQRQIEGTEYTVDCYRSPHDLYEYATARIRLRVDKGEVIDSVIARNLLLEAESLEIARKLNLVGPFCFQWIVEKVGDPYCIEGNARFGGGSTLTIAAGCDMIEMVKNDYLEGGKREVPDKTRDGTLLKRSFSDSIFFQKPKEYFAWTEIGHANI